MPGTFADRVDPAAHRVREGSRDGETNPRPTEGARPGWIDAIEALEHPLDLLDCESRSLISHGNRDFVSIPVRREHDLATVW